MPKKEKASLMKLTAPAKAVEAFIKGGDLPPVTPEATTLPKPMVKAAEQPVSAQHAAPLLKPHFDDSAEFHPEAIILKARHSMRPAESLTERKPVEWTKPESAGEKRTSINLDRELHRRLKILAVKKDSPFQDLVTDAIQAYLRKHEDA